MDFHSRGYVSSTSSSDHLSGFPSGIFTVLVGLLCPIFLHNGISSAKFLSAEETLYLEKRLALDRKGRTKGPFKKAYAKDTFTDYKLWLSGLIYFSAGVGTVRGFGLC
jgi:hypothetical protein